MCAAECPNCSFVEPPKKIVYQLHVTVNPNCDREKFAETVKSFAKPIFISNIYQDGTQVPDVFTSSVVTEDMQTAVHELRAISKILRTAGFEVIREKIETVPWHPLVSEGVKEGQYFEAHITLPYYIQDSLLKLYGLYPSINTAKPELKMATLRRCEGTLEDFNEALHMATRWLPVKKTITEFAIFDSNPNHDKEWMNDSRPS